MRLLRAAAHNFKGLPDGFDETFSDVNVFSGWNASGKSSALDFFNALVVTDNSRHLLTVGTEEGWLLAEFEDDAGIVTLQRTLSPGKIGNPRIKRSDGTSPGAYGEFIQRIVDTATMDPIRKVMSKSPKEQAAILLDTMPWELDYSQVVAAVSGVTGLKDLPAILQNAQRLPALDAIKTVEDCVYAARRDINRDAKKARIHAEELRAPLGPAGEETDWRAKADALLADMQSTAEAEATERTEAEREYGNVRQILAHKSQTARAAVDTDIDAQIAELNRLRAERKDKITRDELQQSEALAKVHQENLDGVVAKYRPQRERLASEHTLAQQNASQRERILQTKKIADDNDREAAALEARSAAMSAALKSLSGIRDGLLEKIPIKDLKVENNQAYLNGVPLQEVNTAEQGKFWVRIAVMRAMKKDWGVVLIDDAEHFDPRNFPILLEACRASGLQFFISRVEPHDLTIERYESTVGELVAQ